MNSALVDTIVDAVLYEGYILYPYRSTSVKNRQRFTFGRVYPRDYSIAQNGAEPYTMQTQCIIENVSNVAVLDLHVRFLHPIARQIGQLPEPLAQLPDRPDPAFIPMPELRIGDRIYQTWEEAIERDIDIPSLAIGSLVEHAMRVPFSFPAMQTIEPIADVDGMSDSTIVGVIARRGEALEGIVEITAAPAGAGAFKLTVRIANHTPFSGSGSAEAIIMHTFASTHTILHASSCEFISMIDPPASLAEAAASCTNSGTWPVLVGKAGERDTLLSSPIILYDYPEIAEASPGSLFDSTEIDEILTLRIMTMTDQEKLEMSQVDAYARQILDRTESITGDELMKMHGVMRESNPLEPGGAWDPFENNAPLESVAVGGVFLKSGDRVRIRPKSRADIMDIALEGRIALIEAIERDFENRLYLALVLDDDPGRDLGMMRQPGHRFFYSPEEVEPLWSEPSRSEP